MAIAFNDNLNQGIEVALAKAYDTWLSHRGSVSSYYPQAVNIYKESLQHIGYDKERKIYIQTDPENAPDDVGERELSTEELAVITQIGPYNIGDLITINPGKSEDMLKALEVHNRFYRKSFDDMSAEIEQYYKTGRPPGMPDSYTDDNFFTPELVAEFESSPYKDVLYIGTYQDYKEEGILDYYFDYQKFITENDIFEDSYFLSHYADHVQKGLIPLPDLPEEIENFAEKYDKHTSVVTKVAYVSALQTGNTELIEALENVYRTIEENYDPDAFGFSTVLDGTNDIIMDVKSLDGISELIDPNNFILQRAPDLEDAITNLAETYLQTKGLLDANIEIDPQTQNDLETLDSVPLTLAYKISLTKGTPAEQEALRETIRNAASTAGDEEYRLHSTGDITEKLARTVLQHYDPSVEDFWGHDNITSIAEYNEVFRETLQPYLDTFTPPNRQPQPPQQHEKPSDHLDNFR